VLAVSCDGGDVTTIEGIANGSQLHAMQEAFREHHALQCGFCTPGMIMAGIDIVNRKGPEPRREGHPRGTRRQHLPVHGLPQTS
jgi:carbon-monoxide dehydrogenase small subunit